MARAETQPEMPRISGWQVAVAIRKLASLLFLAAVALTPVAIILLEPRLGGTWVVGYVAGMVVTPLIAFAALRSILELTGDVEGLVGFVVYGVLVVLISLTAAAWSFLH